MAGKLDRIRYLLSLATDAGASSEEARTAAFTAARLIVANKIELTEPGERRAPPSSGDGQKQGRVIRSRFAGWCHLCRKNYEVGDLIYWTPGAGAVHSECNRKRSAT